MQESPRIISCDDKNSTTDLSSRTATIRLEAGETVTCTFTNEDPDPPSFKSTSFDELDIRDPNGGGLATPKTPPSPNNGVKNGTDDDGGGTASSGTPPSTDTGVKKGTNVDGVKNTTSGGDPVILRTGEFTLSATDLSIPGRGFDFQVKRTYRSQYNFNGPLGHNWEFNHGERLLLPAPEDPDQSVLLADGGGRVDGYVRNPDGSYSSPDGFYNTLSQNPDGSFTIRNRYGFSRNFAGDGRLVSRVDRNGNTMSYSYDSPGKALGRNRHYGTRHRVYLQ